MTALGPFVSLSPLAAFVACLAAVTLFACVGSSVETRATANDMRRVLNDVSADLHDLDAPMQALCTAPRSAHVDACEYADRMYGAVRRATDAAWLAVDLYDRGAVEVQHAQAAIDAADDALDAASRAVAAVRGIVP